MPCMALAMRYPVCAILVCSVVFLEFLGAAAEPLFAATEGGKSVGRYEFLMVLTLLLSVMYCLVGLFLYDGS